MLQSHPSDGRESFVREKSASSTLQLCQKARQCWEDHVTSENVALRASQKAMHLYWSYRCMPVFAQVCMCVCVHICVCVCVRTCTCCTHLSKKRSMDVFPYHSLPYLLKTKSSNEPEVQWLRKLDKGPGIHLPLTPRSQALTVMPGFLCWGFKLESACRGASPLSH